MGMVQAMAEEVAGLMKERLGIRGADLAAKLRHTGRRLPKRIRCDAAILAEACGLADSPKLHKRIDLAQVDAAYRNCVQHLKAVNVSERRKGMVLDISASLAFAFIGLSGLVIAVLLWRGLL